MVGIIAFVSKTFLKRVMITRHKILFFLFHTRQKRRQRSEKKNVTVGLDVLWGEEVAPVILVKSRTSVFRTLIRIPEPNTRTYDEPPSMGFFGRFRFSESRLSAIGQFFSFFFFFIFLIAQRKTIWARFGRNNAGGRRWSNSRQKLVFSKLHARRDASFLPVPLLYDNTSKTYKFTRERGHDCLHRKIHKIVILIDTRTTRTNRTRYIKNNFVKNYIYYK